MGSGVWVGLWVLGSGVRHCGRWMKFGWDRIERICVIPRGEFGLSSDGFWCRVGLWVLGSGVRHCGRWMRFG